MGMSHETLGLAGWGKRPLGKSVRICHPDDRLSDAAQIMSEEDCGSLLVRAREAADRVVGLITDRGICMAAQHGKRLDALRVEEAMSTEVAGIGLREALATAGLFDARSEARPLAVLDEQGELLAIVSLIPLGRGGRVDGESVD